MPFDEPIECPLCMEPLDIDDLNFYPCTCGYQICRFCWHRIRTDENSLCPACRKQYQEDPAEFKPLTEEELTKIKKERRQKDVASRQRAAENRRHLANIRVVQKNLVFVVGLSTRLADTEVLKRQDYFGKYGKILKVVINSSTSYAGAQGPSASAYITYTKPEDCLRAIHAVNNLFVDGRTLKASLGTTKYCSHFLKGTQCNKMDCMYLHELGDEEASFTKEEMQSGKHQDYEQKLVDTYLTPALTAAANLAASAKASSGDGAVVSNGSTTANKSQASSKRKKTDSGSSTGSSKLKEPWPLLNSNRNSNTVTTSKDDVPSEPAPEVIQNAATTLAVIATTTTSVISHNGTNHSSPSSSYSTSSNPRTPTPEALPAAVSRQPTTTAVSTAASSMASSSVGERSSPALTSLPDAMSAPKALLAVRKLPFSDPSEPSSSSGEDHIGQHYNSAPVYPTSVMPNSTKPVSIANTTTQSHMHPPGSLGFPGFTKESDVLIGCAPVDWPAPVTLDTTVPAASDDDLGFDPYMESTKGLADMLENEPGQGLSPLPAYRGNGLGLHSVHQRPRHNIMTAGGDMISAGIMSSIVTPSSPSMLPPSVVNTNTSGLPPPPPGLPAFPQYTSDVNAAGVASSSPTPPPLSAAAGPDVGFRGSRMLSLMNLGAAPNINQSPTPHMVAQSPVNSIPRSPYNDTRMGSIQPPQHGQPAFPAGFPNGMTDGNSSFNTQDLRESLKALLPNASINVLPTNASINVMPTNNPAPQNLQHSRLRNSYMQPGFGTAQNNSSSWNGNTAQPVTAGSLEDQFADPAIVSGCLSSTDASGSPPVQPHWLKSIQQLTEIESSPIKQPTSTQPAHPMSNIPSMYNRPPVTHSRMPFAQNTHISQPGANNDNWPNFQPHNPPPGFPSPFRSTTQNPHMATLES